MIDALANPAVVGAISGLLGTVSGSVATVLVARRKTAPDVQAVTNAAVAGIIQHYTQALAEQTREVHALRGEIADLRDTIEGQNQEIAELNNHIIDLSTALERHGVSPPPRRPRPVVGVV